MPSDVPDADYCSTPCGLECAPCRSHSHASRVVACVETVMIPPSYAGFRREESQKNSGISLDSFRTHPSQLSHHGVETRRDGCQKSSVPFNKSTQGIGRWFVPGAHGKEPFPWRRRRRRLPRRPPRRRRATASPSPVSPVTLRLHGHLAGRSGEGLRTRSRTCSLSRRERPARALGRPGRPNFCAPAAILGPPGLTRPRGPAAPQCRRPKPALRGGTIEGG